MLDRDQYLLNLWGEYQSSWGVHKLDVRVGDESADQSDNEFVSRDLVSVGYQWQKLISQDWKATFEIEMLQSDHKELNPLFESIREDDRLRAEVALEYKVNEDWHVMMRATHLDNDSNQEIYSYTRNKVWVGIRYAF